MSDMSPLSDLSASLQAQSDYNRVDFLTTELALCFTFAAIAVRKYAAGNRESAETSLAHAEKSYETAIHYLSDPKHSKHLTVEEAHATTTELKRIRERLNGLQQLRKQTEPNNKPHDKSSDDTENDMQPQLEKTTATGSALDEISEPQNREEIAAH
jgi:hypothetical protein